jgi:hypothetical protein
MRCLSLAAAALCAAAILPVQAADNWAPAAKQKFTADCITSASTRVDAKQAKTMCECSANAAGKNMSKNDLAVLNEPASNANEEVRARLLQATLNCRTKN